MSDLVKAVAIALGKHAIKQCGRADLTDEQYAPLRDLLDRLHSRVLNNGQEWIDANFGNGTWKLMAEVNAELLCHEEAVRQEKIFSTWPIHSAKLVEEGEWKEYTELAQIAVDAVHEFYGKQTLSRKRKRDTQL